MSNIIPFLLPYQKEIYRLINLPRGFGKVKSVSNASEIKGDRHDMIIIDDPVNSRQGGEK